MTEKSQFSVIVIVVEPDLLSKSVPFTLSVKASLGLFHTIHEELPVSSESSTEGSLCPLTPMGGE